MAGPEGIPVLVLCDGKNLFEDWLAHQGVSWNVGHSASALINEAGHRRRIALSLSRLMRRRSLATSDSLEETRGVGSKISTTDDDVARAALHPPDPGVCSTVSRHSCR